MPDYGEKDTRANALADSLAGGDESVAGELYELTQDLTMRFFSGRVHSAQKSGSFPGDRDEEDLFSLTMQKVFDALRKGRYKSEGRYRQWVVSVGGNVFLDFLRLRAGRRRLVSLDGDEQAESDDEPRRGKEVFVADDVPGRLAENELLNLTLDGLRTLKNEDYASVFTARIFLGLSHEAISGLLGLNEQTCKSHFKRACEGIVLAMGRSPDYKDIPLEGLKTLCEQHFRLEERDLKLVEDAQQRRALELTSQGAITPAELAEGLDVPVPKALQILRAGIVTLAQAKLTRARLARKPGEAVPAESAIADWLWETVGRALAAYPELAEATRAGESFASESESAALCEVSVYLAGRALGRARTPSLGELLCAKIPAEGAGAAAKALGVSRLELQQLMSNTFPRERLDKALLGRIDHQCKLRAGELRAALDAPPARRSSQTRATPADKKAFFDNVRAMILGRKLQKSS